MNAYHKSSGSLAENLINTYDTFLEAPEHLQTPDDLRTFLEREGIEITTPLTEAALRVVRDLREELRAIWNAGTPEEAANRLNALLSPIHATPHVEHRDTMTLTFRAEPDAPLLDRLTLATALNIVSLIQTHGHMRLRHCDSAPCRDVFVDSTRNGSRRFCSDRCANRYNVAAFRERRTAEPQSV